MSKIVLIVAFIAFVCSVTAKPNLDSALQALQRVIQNLEHPGSLKPGPGHGVILTLHTDGNGHSHGNFMETLNGKTVHAQEYDTK